MVTSNLKPLFGTFMEMLGGIWKDAQKEVKQEIEKESAKWIPEVLEEIKSTTKELSREAKDAYLRFIEDIKNDSSLNAKVVECQFLTSEQFFSVVKENIAPNSTEAYAWKIQNNSRLCIHVSYGNDRRLIEKENNVFVVIIASGVSMDVLGMFEESDLIILK